MNILDSIISSKKEVIQNLPQITAQDQNRPSFIEAILRNPNAIITEIKPKSPSSGILIKNDNIPALIEVYNDIADAISVLCDEKFFGGSFDLLKKVSENSIKPILAKEFIISTKQLDHAKHNGASAILLIVATLSEDELLEFTTYAIEIQLDVLIETHSEKDVNKVINLFVKLSDKQKTKILIGINNRNLDTFEIDLATTELLAPLIRKSIPKVTGIITESGCETLADIERLSPYVQGYLIGTSILKSNDPREFIRFLCSNL